MRPLALAAALVLAPTLALAQSAEIPGSEFEAGNWYGGAYTDDGGAFSYCYITVSYQNGQDLWIGLYPNDTLSILLRQPDVKFQPGQKFELWVMMETGIPAIGNGEAGDADYGGITYDGIDATIDFLNSGRYLNLWFANASGELIENSGYINWSQSACASGPEAASDDMSGNYGSCFSDFDSDGDIDLYIAKCRQGVNDPDDCRRWNRMFVNDGSNTYSDEAEDLGLQIRNQTWTANFGDYDNDGDLDMVATNHDATIQLFENVNNNFIDVTSGCGMEFNGFFLQSKFVDFDNDGFLDVLIAGGSEYFFKGNGDGTFTEVAGLFPAGRDMHSFATGDLNNDGFQDVFANYGTGYVTHDAAQTDRLWLTMGTTTIGSPCV